MAKHNTAKLGDLARDSLTDYEGVITVTSEFLNGCRRLCLAPKIKEDGTFMEERWFDEPQIIVVESGYYKQPDLHVTDIAKIGGVQKPTPRSGSI